MNVSKSCMRGETADPHSRTVHLLRLLSHNIKGVCVGGADLKVWVRNIKVGLETRRCKEALKSDGLVASPQC